MGNMPMKPCPACGANDWKQSSQQAQQDQYECAKCGFVANGADIEMGEGSNMAPSDMPMNSGQMR